VTTLVQAETPKQEETKGKQGKEKLTIPLPQDLVDRMRNAAYWDPELTIAGIAEQALRAAMEQIEKDRGGPFPPRKSALRGGRPVGSGKAGNASNA
jgi:hypothetical protein